MEITCTDNLAKSLIDILMPHISNASELKFGVAFVKYSGLRLIEKVIVKALHVGSNVEFLVGLDFRTTEPRVLRTLHAIGKTESNLKLWCFSDPSTDDTPVYHPKIYLIREDDIFTISVGSSNLTYGGLKNNVEINIIIQANKKEEIVSDVYGIYNRLKFQKNRFEPDLDYIDEYEKIYESVHKKNIAAFKDKRTKNKIENLQERESILPRPNVAKAELFGWQKLIYDKLPEGHFKTSDMYVYEDEFQKFYPENRHIKDKIRQILQQLRDIGFLKHIAQDRWLKI